MSCDPTRLGAPGRPARRGRPEVAIARHLEGCGACRATLEGSPPRAAGGATPGCSPARRRDPARPRHVRGRGRLARASSSRRTSRGSSAGSAPYEVTEVIGRGGMGRGPQGVRPALNRFVAIKVLAPELATSATARRRFAREARAAAAVAHDHIVAIHAVDATPGGLPYLVMQYVSGRSLQERLERAGPLDVARGPADRDAGGARAGRGARRRAGPPRRQAGEHPPGERRRARQADRLRPRPRGRRRQPDAERASSPARRSTWRPSRPAASRSTRGPTCSAWAASFTRSAPAARRSAPRRRWACSAASARTRPGRSASSIPRSPTGSRRSSRSSRPRTRPTGSSRPPRSPTCSAAAWPTWRTPARAAAVPGRPPPAPPGRPGPGCSPPPPCC